LLPLLRKHWKFFLVATLAALALRLMFVIRFPVLQGDTLGYADIARHWLNHHSFALTDINGGYHPTLIRLPGYPAFLAAIFAIFGQDNFRAVMLTQMLFDISTCFIVAAIALRISTMNSAGSFSAPEDSNLKFRNSRFAFLLAALCPFTANYVGTPLTETLSIFFSAASLLLAIIGLDEHRLRPWILCGLSTGCAILLRPDGGLLLGAIALHLLWRAHVPSRATRSATRVQSTNHKLVNYKFAAVLAAVSLAPLIPWTVRNYRTFHIFQPLVTFAATDPGEFHPAGWDRWIRTWMIDYVTMEDVTFHVSGEPIDIGFVPPRAFHSEAERQRVAQLFAAYNENTDMVPELDAQFADIARASIHRHPLRNYLVMPAARLASMWFRPRTEMLPLDSHWWRFEDDPHDSSIAMALGFLNLLLVGTAVVGAVRAFRPDAPLRYAGLLLTFVAVRSLFMMYAGVAEPRYVLECYPVVLIFAAHALTAVNSSSVRNWTTPAKNGHSPASVPRVNIYNSIT
jgi:Dolichyl-phosphate-mannose-protein mannosyltransferase